MKVSLETSLLERGGISVERRNVLRRDSGNPTRPFNMSMCLTLVHAFTG